MMAYKRMEKIFLNRDKSMTTYLNELKQARNDILEAGGTYNEDHMVAKITRSLSPQPYGDFVYDHLEMIDEIPRPNDITARLHSLEPTIKTKAAKSRKGKRGK